MPWLAPVPCLLTALCRVTDCRKFFFLRWHLSGRLSSRGTCTIQGDGSGKARGPNEVDAPLTHGFRSGEQNTRQWVVLWLLHSLARELALICLSLAPGATTPFGRTEASEDRSSNGSSGMMAPVFRDGNCPSKAAFNRGAITNSRSLRRRQQRAARARS
jgi:hypothetical protein